MPTGLPTPENFPQPQSAGKIEREQKEDGQEKESQRETLDDAIDQGLDQAQTAAGILNEDMSSRMQAIANQGAALKPTDHQLLQSLLGQGKKATNNLVSTLNSLQEEKDEDEDKQNAPSQKEQETELPIMNNN